MTLARLFEDKTQFRPNARELNRMTARELSDIGMSRFDMPTARRTAR
ncbi:MULTISPECIES: DUF1127 domain-containing protein [unclassified Aureimonas]|nr:MULTISPECIES: DUF1127 domain-containing protein [unclassified Aureimonas]ALN74965.1 hypothetical protein M673_19755 [Aureimonas sp. AU20]